MENLNKKLPDSPGIYFFRKGRKILYIGKATSLKDRVRSYFNSDILASRGHVVIKMVELADDVDFKKTDSVLEALLLESSLIKKYKPKYNTKEKDDKSYYFVVFTNEEYPRVFVMRGKNLFAENKDKYRKVFGPFPHGSELREAMNILRKIFPFRDKCLPAGEAGVPNSGKLCFEAQIGLCPGICDGAISKEEYLKSLNNLELFMSGKKTRVIKDLEKEMNSFAKERKFELAEGIKRQIFSLKHIKDVAMIKNTFNEGFVKRENIKIEAYDISHFGGKDRVGVMTVVENGEIKKSDYRKFKIKNDFEKANDILDLKEVLDRRFTHIEWRFPDIVVVDGGKAQLNVAEKMLKELKLNEIKVAGVVKGESHKPVRLIGNKEVIKKYESEILLANSEAHRFAIGFQKSRRGF